MQVSFFSFQKFSAREQSLERIARKLSRNNSRIASVSSQCGASIRVEIVPCSYMAYTVTIKEETALKECTSWSNLSQWSFPLTLWHRVKWLLRASTCSAIEALFLCNVSSLRRSFSGKVQEADGGMKEANLKEGDRLLG
mgnify:CR=1 FL=1